ncbi:Yip1 domain-containing protein [Octadecabacter temperatus]|uniref:Yip1 domain protein n=1 Tax=Octadecabacter temperatus TaxID=1458307 RepID=A0A0K0Y4V4_9RHOB|nr:YIP1 family protein [Octadecabacter temperatus]AKS45906.1 Yip1 domain protein [Octadecabacter temperatus]SIO03214.1 Yip1 domain-containing protein [Octadecabacter temperatus]
MDLSFANLLEWTKLTVRNPRLAFELVKSAKLPLEVSILMIVLAGVVSAVAAGAHYIMIGSPDIILPISETQGLQMERAGPIAQGLIAVLSGIGGSFALFWVGQRMGGQGDLADIFGVTAVLQMVVTALFVVVYLTDIILPIFAFGLLLVAFYVALRGLGHAVNVGHDFNSLGRSAWVAVIATVVLFMALVFGASILGLTPQGTIVPLPIGNEL